MTPKHWAQLFCYDTPNVYLAVMRHDSKLTNQVTQLHESMAICKSVRIAFAFITNILMIQSVEGICTRRMNQNIESLLQEPSHKR